MSGLYILPKYRSWHPRAARLPHFLFPKRKEWLTRPPSPCVSCASPLPSLSWSLSCEDISLPKSCAFLCVLASLCSSLSWFSSPCSYFVFCAKSQPHSPHIPQSVPLLDDVSTRLPIRIKFIEIGFVRVKVSFVDCPHFIDYLIITSHHLIPSLRYPLNRGDTSAFRPPSSQGLPYRLLPCALRHATAWLCLLQLRGLRRFHSARCARRQRGTRYTGSGFQSSS